MDMIVDDALMIAGSDMRRVLACNTPPPIAAEIRDALILPVIDTLSQDTIPPENKKKK
jgi:hypothetical protein